MDDLGLGFLLFGSFRILLVKFFEVRLLPQSIFLCMLYLLKFLKYFFLLHFCSIIFSVDVRLPLLQIDQFDDTLIFMFGLLVADFTNRGDIQFHPNFRFLRVYIVLTL